MICLIIAVDPYYLFVVDDLNRYPIIIILFYLLVWHYS